MEQIHNLDIKQIEKTGNYRDRCSEARKNITKAIEDGEKLTLGGIDKVAKVKVNKLLAEDQMKELINKLLDCLEQNEIETNIYLESIKIPSQPKFLAEILETNDENGTKKQADNCGEETNDPTDTTEDQSIAV